MGLDVNESRKRAVAVLSLVWRSVPLGTFDQRKIWDIFLRRVQISAVQNVSLEKFFEMLCRKMKVQSILGTVSERKAVAEILESDTSDEVLAELRNYPQLCVLHVRVAQEQKKAIWEEGGAK